MMKLRTMIQETVDLEIQEIFGLFGKKPTPADAGSTEQLPQDSVQQTAPKEKFSLLALKQLKTSKDIRVYVRRTLKLLGSPGQARAAYEIDDQRILKLALSDNKTYQNKNEVQNSKCIGPAYAVQVFSHHPLYVWLIEERVQPLTSSEQLVQKFNQLAEIGTKYFKFRNSSDIQMFLTEMPRLLSNASDNPEFQQRHDFLMAKSPWYKGLIEKLTDCQVASWDFHKDNWGIRPSTGDLVLLDIGFNRTATSPEEEFFKEFIEHVTQEELEHKQTFDASKLRSLKTLEEIHAYCYETLGNETMNGATRITWVIDDSSVIKVVYRHNGTIQNKQEVKNAECLGERYAVKVFDYDHEHFYWIIEEHVKSYPTAYVVPEFVDKINSILGTDYDDWYPIMVLFFYGSNPEKNRLMRNNEWFRGIVHALEQCDVGSHDLHPGNWGIRPSTGELVILDLGF